MILLFYTIRISHNSHILYGAVNIFLIFDRNIVEDLKSKLNERNFVTNNKLSLVP